jgi:hypothetical protein
MNWIADEYATITVMRDTRQVEKYIQKSQQMNPANENGKWKSGMLARQSKRGTALRGKPGRSLEANKHADVRVEQRPWQTFAGCDGVEFWN